MSYVSTPPYPICHFGPCIVAGMAACLHDDLRRVWDVFPDAPVIAVNGASREVKAIALVSQHPDRMVAPGFEWVRHQTRKFGSDFTVHVPGNVLDNFAFVNYWWSVKRCGGSAWFGRKVASLIGFSPVILCGCPLIPGPYVGNHNIGGYMHVDSIVDTLRREIEADTDWHKDVYSMSGWTKELLGELC